MRHGGECFLIISSLLIVAGGCPFLSSTEPSYELHEDAFMTFKITIPEGKVKNGKLAKYWTPFLPEGLPLFRIFVDDEHFEAEPFAVGMISYCAGQYFTPMNATMKIGINFRYHNGAITVSEVFHFDILFVRNITQVLYTDCVQFYIEDKEAPCRGYNSSALSWKLCPNYHLNADGPVLLCSSALPTPGDDDDDDMPAFAYVPMAVGIVVTGVIVLFGLVLFFRHRRLQLEQKAQFDMKILEQQATERAKTMENVYDEIDDNVEEHSHQYTQMPLSVAAKLIGVDVASRAALTALDVTLLRMEDKHVAVKLLPESSGDFALRDFMEEISILKKIGHHERLVTLIGCVTVHPEPLLIMEYYAQGDLLHYLSYRRSHMLQVQSVLKEGMPGPEVEDDLIVTAKQQLMFMMQVATGMEYLSQKGFVHRDIAARNILVDDRHSCRIGDFGLCRHVDQADEVYMSKGGRLPLKWMPPEAIRNYEFSTKSDVWSFGILVFEIVTLGGSPYSGWPATDILAKLDAGERLVRPDNCTDELYDLMMCSWTAKPENRPTFSDLKHNLGKMLEKASQDYYYLFLDANKDYYELPKRF